MNRHFNDAEYYARRTVEQVLQGIRTAVGDLESSVRSRFGDDEPEPTRLERIRMEVDRGRERVSDRVRTLSERGRSRLAR